MPSFLRKLKLGKSATARQPSPASVGEPSHQSPPLAPAEPGIDASPSTLGLESTIPTLQARLWNGAYDALKEDDPKLINAYETILSARLKEIQGINDEPLAANDISASPEKRCKQMHAIAQYGLNKSVKTASVAEKAEQGFQMFASVKSIITTALQSVPQAAVPWAGVCMGLEILASPVTQYQSNRSGLKYVLLRMDWYWNLALLLLNENMIDDSSRGFSAEMETNVMKLYQKLLEYQIKSVCVHHRNGLLTFGVNTLKLDDWEGKLKSLKEEEQRLGENAAQYNTELVKTQLQHILESAQAREIQLSGIQDAIQDGNQKEEARHREERDNQCLRDLCVSDPRSDKKYIEERKGGLLKDSYVWITQHESFQQFLTDTDTKLLWIDGGAGKGKTMLMCGIIDELQATHRRLSYFFCQQTDSDLNSATKILRGLLFMLAAEQPKLLPFLRAKYDEQGQKCFEARTAWVALKDVFKAMITSTDIAPTVILVDALDECATDRSEFLDFLLHCLKLDAPMMKWIVSSRDKWIDIEEKMRKAEQKVRVQLHVDQELVSNAIHIYIRRKVDDLASVKNYTDTIKKEIEEFLSENATGTFLWVALVCQALSGVPRRRAVETMRTFPPGLGPLYRRMLHDVEKNVESALCKEVLATACLTLRPLTLSEFKALLPGFHDFGDDEAEEVIGQCGSFLSTQGSLVQFIHQSAKDFLLDEATSDIFSAGVTQHHQILFRWSIDALRQTLRRDIYDIKQPGTLMDDVITPNPDPLASITYPCLHWIDHLWEARSISQSDMKDTGFLDLFLRQKVLYWFESLALLRNLGKGVRALVTLEAATPNTSSGLGSLAKDAIRFLRSNKGALETAPLQAYASALMFSPQESLVRGLFYEDRIQDISLERSPEINWSPCIHTLGFDRGEWVDSVAYVPGNDERLITTSVERAKMTIQIWDTATGDRIQSLAIPIHSYKSNRFDFSWNKKIAVVDTGSTATELWDLDNGALLQVLDSPLGSLSSLQILPDDEKVFLTFSTGLLKIWDTKTGNLSTINTRDWFQSEDLISPDDGIWGSYFMSQDQRVALMISSVTGKHLELRIYEMASGECVKRIPRRNFPGPSSRSLLAFSEDGRKFAIADSDLTVWDASKLNTSLAIGQSGGHTVCIEFSQDASMIASVTLDGHAKLWDTSTGALLKKFSFKTQVRCLSFSHSGTRIATGGFGDICIWDLELEFYSESPVADIYAIISMSLSADQTKLAVGSENGAIRIWDTKSNSCLHEWHREYTHEVVFSPNASILLTTTTQNTVACVWDVSSGACLLETDLADGQRFESPSVYLWHSIFSNDGIRVISRFSQGDFIIWDAVTGVQLEMYRPKGYGTETQPLPDGTKFSFANFDNQGQARDVARQHSALLSFMSSDFRNTLLVRFLFSPNGKYMAAFNTIKSSVTVWDVETGACLRQVKEASYSLASPAMFTSNGQNVVTCREETDSSMRYITVSSDHRWVIRDGLPVVWLPPPYRMGRLQRLFTATRDMIAIRTPLGGHLIFKADEAR